MLTNINRFSSLLGFEKTLTPLRLAKAVQVLGKCYRYTFYDGNMCESKEILSEAEFIVYTIQEGRKPEARIERPCNKCSVSQCVNKDTCAKGKTTYHMWASKSGTKITKTGFDFAQWLIAEGLTCFAAVEKRIDAENAEKEKKEQDAARIASERQAAAEAEKSAENEYKSWLRETVRNYGGINTPEGTKILIQRDIFLDVLGEYPVRAKSLLVLIDNFDNPLCRRDVISRLHNGNVASIKTFEHITGIKLAKAYEERAAQLDAITKADFAAQPKQYKPRRDREEADYNSVFYKKQCAGGSNKAEFVEARGRLWKHGGYDFFIMVSGSDEKQYTITEGKTGFLVARAKTLKAAQDAVRELANNMCGGKPLNIPFADMVNHAVEKEGLSPLYK